MACQNGAARLGRGRRRARAVPAKNVRAQLVGGNERLDITALGLYRCFINGKRVGHDLLTPGWTCYDKRLAYQSYDVAEYLKPGSNQIDIWLADGWYRSRLMWTNPPLVNTWGDALAAMAEIRESAEHRRTRHSKDGCDLAERAHADPEVRHLFRRNL